MLKEIENDMPELFEWQSVPSMGPPAQIKELTELSKVEVDLPSVFGEEIPTMPAKNFADSNPIETKDAPGRHVPTLQKTAHSSGKHRRHEATEHLSRTLDVAPVDKKKLLMLAIGLMTLLILLVALLLWKKSSGDSIKKNTDDATKIEKSSL